MEFAWDPAKAAINIQKHKIDFLDAITVFDDPLHLVKDGIKPAYGEVRHLAIGTTHDGRMVTVIYTDREQVRRIISARKMRKNEQREYDQGKTTS